MSQLTWSRTATANLQQLAEFIREFSPRREQEIIDLLLRTANQLRSHPHSGQHRETQPDGSELRSLLVGRHYRLSYLISPAQADIIILQVVDVRSSPPRYYAPRPRPRRKRAYPVRPLPLRA